MDSLLTAVNSIHPVDEPPLASCIDCWFLNWFMSLWGKYCWMVFHGLSFGFPLVMYQGPKYVIWKVFRVILFGVPAVHVSWCS